MKTPRLVAGILLLMAALMLRGAFGERLATETVQGEAATINVTATTTITVTTPSLLRAERAVVYGGALVPPGGASVVAPGNYTAAPLGGGGVVEVAPVEVVETVSTVVDSPGSLLAALVLMFIAAVLGLAPEDFLAELARRAG